MSESFLALCWRKFPTSRPRDYQIREAAKLFLRALERKERSDRIAVWTAQTFRAGVESRDSSLLRCLAVLLNGLGRKHEDQARDFQRAAEMLEEADRESDFRLMEAQIMARKR
jgi:hypothetical protein